MVSLSMNPIIARGSLAAPFLVAVVLLLPTTVLAGDEATISGLAWEDENRNGVSDDGTDMVGVEIELLNAINQVVQSQVTAAGGTYSFTVATPATYHLRVVLPAGFLATWTGLGTTINDSDFDRSTLETPPYTVSNGDVVANVDVGLDEKDFADLVLEDLEFDWVKIGESWTIPYRLANTGEGAAQVTSIVTGIFSIFDGTCPPLPFTLASATECSFDVTYSPSNGATSGSNLVLQTAWNVSNVALGSLRGSGASVVHVDPGAVGPGNGTTWGEAFTSLSAGLAAASFNQSVWMTSGIYRAGTAFQVPSTVHLVGGFVGTEGATLARNLTTGDPTVLSGDIGADDVDGDSDGVTENAEDQRGMNAERLLTLNGWSRLDGLVLTAADGGLDGVAIHSGNDLDLRHLRVVGNQGPSVVRSTASKVTVTETEFSGNQGTALLLESPSSVVIESSQFVGNFSGTSGGAIRATGVQFDEGTSGFELRSTVLAGNTSTADGGALFFQSAGARGGGGALPDSKLVIERSTFVGNRAAGSGGAMSFQLSVAGGSVSESILWGNEDSTGQGTATASSYSSLGQSLDFSTSDVQGSGGSSGWNTAFGNDGGANLDSTPLFVHELGADQAPTAGSDLRLWADSGLFDLGSIDPIEPVDAAGAPRVDGTAADLGALEGAVVGVYGRAWSDIDADGIQDPGEPGLAGVSVGYNGGGRTGGTVTTASDGRYWIPGLPSQNYGLTFGLVAGTAGFSLADQGDDSLDSDVDPSGYVLIAVSDDSPTVDAGLLPDTVFQDSFESGDTSLWSASN